MSNEMVFKAVHPATGDIEDVESIKFSEGKVWFYDGDGFDIDDVVFVDDLSKWVKKEDEIDLDRVRQFVDQPVDGLLYDLNMLPEVLSASGKVNKKEWLLMKVIQVLKEDLSTEPLND